MTPHIAVGALFRSVSRILFGVLLACLVLFGIGVIIVAQAGRDELVNTDTAVLMIDGTESARAARVDRAVRLYLAGQVSRLILAGNDPTPARDALIGRGVVPDKIVEVREATQITQIDQVQRVFQESRIANAILIGEPVEALRLLKIARDRGLDLSSVPAGADNAISLNQVVDEVGRYLNYCFVGR